MSLIDDEYNKLIDAMTPAERVARSARMLAWTRGLIARQIVSERGPISAERLKWEVALRQYGSEPQARAMIEGMLARVSD